VRRTGAGCAARACEVEFGHGGRECQQDQRVQADDREVDLQPDFTEQCRRHRDADLHRVAEGRRDRAHRRRCGWQ
jgi:hypothetical protein